MNLTVRAEDIMTPRRLLKHAANDADAQAADRGGFDAVPLLRPDGLVREFWSRADRKPRPRQVGASSMIWTRNICRWRPENRTPLS